MEIPFRLFAIFCRKFLVFSPTGCYDPYRIKVMCSYGDGFKYPLGSPFYVFAVNCFGVGDPGPNLNMR